MSLFAIKNQYWITLCFVADLLAGQFIYYSLFNAMPAIKGYFTVIIGWQRHETIETQKIFETKPQL